MSNKFFIMVLLSCSIFSSHAQNYKDDFVVVSAQYVSSVNMSKSEQISYCSVFDCESPSSFYKLKYRVIKSFTSQKKNPKIIEVFADCKYCFQNKYQLLFLLKSKHYYLYDFNPIYPTKNKNWAASYDGIDNALDVYIQNLDDIEFNPLVKFPLTESTSVKKKNILDKGIYKINDGFYYLSKGLYLDDYFEKYLPIVLENYEADIDANEIKRENY